MDKVKIVVLTLGICIFLCGCGETIRGVGKDLRRMGKGVKTIFISEEE